MSESEELMRELLSHPAWEAERVLEERLYNDVLADEIGVLINEPHYERIKAFWSGALWALKKLQSSREIIGGKNDPRLHAQGT